MDLVKNRLRYWTYKVSPDHAESTMKHDHGFGSFVLGLFGLEPSPSEEVPARSTGLTASELKLCPACEAEVAKWSQLLARQAEQEAEADFHSRVVYDALACFASGALMGIVFGILRD